MKLEIETSLDDTTRQQIEQLWHDCSGSFEAVVTGWITEKRSLTFMNGWDEATGDKRVYLLFEEAGTSVAEAFVPMDQAQNLMGALGSLVPPPVGSGRADKGNGGRERAYFKTREKLLKPTWDEELLSNVFTMENAVKIAIAYTLTEHGEVTFRKAHEETYEDAEAVAIPLEQLVFVSALVANSRRMAACESFYALREL